MSDYKIITEKFEGPLDLLMHLIEKNKLDIYDIPIATVTEQYMAYIAGMQEFDIELASEFLVMAAILLQIKSRLLLPKKLVVADEEAIEDENDPRLELIERLTTYRKFRVVSSDFFAMWEKNNCYVVREPMEFAPTKKMLGNLTLEELLSAIANLLDDSSDLPVYIKNEEVHIKDKISDILHLLKIKHGKITLQDTLIRSGSINELVTAFLAVLELLKIGKIRILQQEKFGAIFLYSCEEI